MGYDRFIDLLPVDTWKFLPHTFAYEISYGLWTPYDYLIMLSHIIATAVARGGGRIIISLPPRHGKAMDIHTPIPTPNGWKEIGNLHPGDKVFDESGLPCNVVAITPVWKNRPSCKVITDSNDEITADYEHEWKVRLCRKHKIFKIHTTKYLLDRTSERKAMIQKHHGLQLPDKIL